jgi:branched-chain amino acid transport system substrate-binding protein
MARRLKTVTLLVVILGLLLVLAACGGGETTTTTAAQTTSTTASATTDTSGAVTTATSPETTTGGPATGEPINIGLACSLTGIAATGGASISQGALAMIEMVNAEGGIGGRPLEAVLEDDKSDVTALTAVLNGFIEKEVFAVIGPFANWLGDAARGITEKAQIPEVIGSPITLAGLENFKTNGFKWSVFPDCSVNVLADALVKTLKLGGHKNVLAVSDVLAGNQEPLDLAIKLAAADGITITKIGDTFGMDGSDIEPVVNKLMEQYNALKPDAFIVMGVPPTTPVIYRSLRDRGVTEPVYGNAIVAHPATIMVLGPEAVEGLFALDSGGGANPAAMPDDWPSKAVQLKFVDFYTKKYDMPPDSIAMSGASYVTVLVDAMKRAGELDREKVRAAMHAITDLPSTQGLLSFSAENPNEGLQLGQMVLYQIKGGQFELTQILK